ncbi:MAG: hypothetical protein RLY86_3070 [Pseudomonadota bacterium]
MSPHLSAARCLFLVAHHHGLQLSADELPLAETADIRTAMLAAMRKVSLKGRVMNRAGWDKLAGLGTAYPAMAIRRDGGWVIVAQVITMPDGSCHAAVLDPALEHEGLKLVTRADFEAVWDGTLVVCRRFYALTDENQPFGLRWFFPEILRHASYFRGVALAAVLSNVIGLCLPLLFQVLIDKVITHRSYQTLFVVVGIYIMLSLFDAFFSYVRQRLMLLASNKIDAKLTSRTFSHLLSLPLHFFEQNAAGVLVRHMQQTESLRHFLTGRLFQTLLDAATLPILLVLLVFYSSTLTLIVLAFSAAIAAVIGGMVPIYRRELDQLYQAEGARQAHLVESIHGMRAVKSLVLEPLRQKSWDNKVAQAVRGHASVGRIGAIGSVATSTLEKVMQITVLAVGATLAFNGTLSLGALVAFMMLSNRVTGPLVQIVALINEYQQAALSVKMLGNVMNAEPERGSGLRHAKPPISGAMTFDEVTFRYPGASMPALDRVSFEVKPGEVIGIVGRSGSGKTTVTRLVQAIHTPQSGLIRLDGVDIRHIDLRHLRRSIGVVLQENLLFRGTIRDNIAAARPDAQLHEILEAARMAGADEFIDRLPLSYDTFVEENASNFSGGQRQRIAIARALLLRPQLLIFDEATSALDPESEAIVQRNLSSIAKGRTVLIVSHRLSSLTKSDRILVLEHGKVVDCAPHEVLLDRCDIYRHLWQTQTQHVQ